MQDGARQHTVPEAVAGELEFAFGRDGSSGLSGVGACFLLLFGRHSSWLFQEGVTDWSLSWVCIGLLG